MSLDAFLTTSFDWERQTSVKNPMGAAVQSWEIFGDFMGSIQPASSQTVSNYAVEGIAVTHTVFTYDQDFHPGDRLVSGTDVYNVIAAKPYVQFGSIVSYTAVDVAELKVS